MTTYAENTIKSIGIKDAALFRQKVYINGKWEDSDNKKTSEITNPSTGEVLGTVPNCGATEAKRAIEAANKAWPEWRSKTAKERALILRRWYELMMENQEDLDHLHFEYLKFLTMQIMNFVKFLVLNYDYLKV